MIDVAFQLFIYRAGVTAWKSLWSKNTESRLRRSKPAFGWRLD